MANETIDDLTPNGALDGTEQLELQRAAAGVSRKTTTGDVAKLGAFPLVATPIASGAAPVDVDPTLPLFAVTSGGTGGTEIVNIPNLAPTVGGSTTPEWIGARLSIYLAVMTDPADLVVISVGGSQLILNYPFGSSNAGEVQITASGPQLTGVGAVANYVWAADGWQSDYAMTNGEANTIFETTPQNQLGSVVTANALPAVDTGVGYQLWNNLGAVALGGLATPAVPIAAQTVAHLTGTYPPAAAGRKATVSDALAPAFGAVVVGGGAVVVPVYDDGVDWRVG